MPMNVTTNAISEVGGATIGWGVTIVVIVLILATLFLISRNIRRMFIGAAVTIGALIIYWISRLIGSSAGDGDYFPLKVFLYAIGFVLVSIGAGWLLEKFGIMKKVEDKLIGDEGEESQKAEGGVNEN